MKIFAVLTSVFLFTGTAWADAVPGKSAPTFEIQDANGKAQKITHTLHLILKNEW